MLSSFPSSSRACYVISLRPADRHAGLRRAARRHGIGCVALPPWRIVPRDDAETRKMLGQALQADCVVVTSAEAVRAANALHPLAAVDTVWCAVGAGSARALQRVGVREIVHPARMDSEGLLALPALQHLQGKTVTLLTAPGGRGVIIPTLIERGATVLRADVYERRVQTITPRALQAWRTRQGDAWLVLTSGEALAVVLDQLTADDAARLRRTSVVAASERLAALARDAGFARVVVAAGPRPAQVLQAIVQAR